MQSRCVSQLFAKKMLQHHVPLFPWYSQPPKPTRPFGIGSTQCLGAVPWMVAPTCSWWRPRWWRPRTRCVKPRWRAAMGRPQRRNSSQGVAGSKHMAERRYASVCLEHFAPETLGVGKSIFSFWDIFLGGGLYPNHQWSLTKMQE